MTADIGQKIHWKPGGAPVVADPVEAPAAAAALGRELANQQSEALVYLAGVSGPLTEREVGPDLVEGTLHTASLRGDGANDTVVTMNDSIVTPAQEARAGAPPRRRADWLMLIHQIQPKPDYLRVKVRRRLQRIGAIALKNSVYLLPRRDDTREDFEWLVGEIRADGGEATLCRTAVLAGTTDEEITAMFRTERSNEYGAIAEEAGALLARGDPTDDELGRLRRRLEETERIDYFDAPGRAAAEAALASGRPGDTPAVTGRLSPPRGATWVTRSGIKVDRIASAWLIRRFIDPAARFKFVPAKGYRPERGELRFDMYQGEFTHEADRCTFETLLARFSLADPGLGGLAEIVHDVDLKDGKFGRTETAGVAALIDGLVLAYPNDAERLERGAAVFEGMYAYISTGAQARSAK